MGNEQDKIEVIASGRAELQPPVEPPRPPLALIINNDSPQAIADTVSDETDPLTIGFVHSANLNHPIDSIESTVYKFLLTEGGERQRTNSIATKFNFSDKTFFDSSRAPELVKIFKQFGYELDDTKITIANGDYGCCLTLFPDGAETLVYARDGVEGESLSADKIATSKEQVVDCLSISKDLTEVAITALTHVLSNGATFPELRMDWLPPKKADKANDRTSSTATETDKQAHFDQKLLDYVADEFKEKHGIDLRKDPIALIRVREAIGKARANFSSLSQKAEINVPYIAGGANGPIHLETTLTRAQFEKITGIPVTPDRRVREKIDVFIDSSGHVARVSSADADSVSANASLYTVLQEAFKETESKQAYEQWRREFTKVINDITDENLERLDVFHLIMPGMEPADFTIEDADILFKYFYGGESNRNIDAFVKRVINNLTVEQRVDYQRLTDLLPELEWFSRNLVEPGLAQAVSVLICLQADKVNGTTITFDALKADVANGSATAREQKSVKSNTIVKKAESSETGEVGIKEAFGLERLMGLAPETMAELVNIVDSLKNPKMAELMRKYGFKDSNGAVFWGPPGTGKSLAGKALAEETGYERVVIKIDKYLTKWLHESANLLGGKLREVKEKSREKPLIVQIDEADTILIPIPTEDYGGTHDRTEVRAVLLREFEEPSNMFFILTTNLDPTNPQEADPAIVRNERIGNIIGFRLPDQEGRRALLVKETGKRSGIDLTWKDIDFEILAHLSEGFNPADIQIALTRAFRKAYDKRTNSAVVTQKHLEEAINSVRTGKQTKLKNKLQ